MTFAWMTWEVSRDPLSLGYLGLAQGVPLVLFQLFGGVLADRIDRLRMLIVTQILTAGTLTIAFALTMSGLVRLEHLLVLAALSNTFRAFDEPSRMALVPQLVERDRLANAIALGSIPWQAGRMIGPSITGILIAAFGGAIGFGLAALASYTALALYSRLRLRGTASAGTGLPVLVLVGFCNTFYLMQVSTFLQQKVPDHLRGRVMSLYSLCWNLLPLGGLIAGALAAAVDARFAVLFGGAMVAANALLLLASRRLRVIS